MAQGAVELFTTDTATCRKPAGDCTLSITHLASKLYSRRIPIRYTALIRGTDYTRCRHFDRAQCGSRCGNIVGLANIVNLCIVGLNEGRDPAWGVVSAPHRIVGEHMTCRRRCRFHPFVVCMVTAIIERCSPNETECGTCRLLENCSQRGTPSGCSRIPALTSGV